MHSRHYFNLREYEIAIITIYVGADFSIKRKLSCNIAIYHSKPMMKKDINFST